MIINVCKICGKEFQAKRRSEKYCSKECGKKALSEYRKGKEPWNKGIPITDEQKAKFRESVKKTWTDEKREAQRKKQKEVWSDPELLEKHSEKCKEHMTDEYKEEISRRTREAMQREEVKDKVKAAANNEETKAKRRATNLERYGAEYVVLTENFLTSKSTGKTNEDWRRKLKLTKKDCEFPLEHYIYDFKIGNILIEINPTYTHNSTEAPRFSGSKECRVLDKDYHFNKSLIAQKHGYICFHVWDWDNEDDIIRKLNALQNEVLLDYCVLCDANIEDVNTLCKNNTYNIENISDKDYYIGLKYNETLIAVGIFKYIVDSEYEFKYVVDNKFRADEYILNLLFNRLLINSNASSVIVNIDFNKDNTLIYSKIGFKVKEYCGPRSNFYNIKTHEYKTDCLTEGFLEVFDAGNIIMTWNRE